MMILSDYVLVSILVTPLVGCVIIALMSNDNKEALKLVALNTSVAPFLASLVVCLFFQRSTSSFQFVFKKFWLEDINLTFTLGIDGISLVFLLLTTFLLPLCLIISWDAINDRVKEFLVFFLLLDFFLIGSFCSLNLLLFYVFFESVLIPMFLIIGIWGSRERKVLAAYYFFMYTLLGSIIMLLAIVYILVTIGTSDYEILAATCFTTLEQKVMWLAFFFAFAGKVPMVPVHLWLPEAHVEAPTSGSVLLAGVLLKLGTYGFVRFSLPLFPKASFFFAPLVYTLALMGIVHASFTAIRQTDFKRVIAYTSIAHMNLVVLGIFSFNVVGIEGAIIQSLSHGFVSSALFMVIGVIYDRHGTRIVTYYGGLASVMPLYIIVFLFFTLANMSFPGTGSFVGELLILVGSFKSNAGITLVAATSTITGGAYSLWLFNRIAYGNLKTQYVKNFADLSPRELSAFVPLVLGTLILGLYPNIFLCLIHASVNNIVELLYT